MTSCVLTLLKAPSTSSARPLAAPAPLSRAHYQAARVQTLFDGLAATYDWAEWLSAGLLRRWRRRLATSLRPPLDAPADVVDLMAGGAEMWPVLRQHFGPELRLTAVDFSAPMLARSVAQAAGPALTLLHADALATPLPAGQATAVTCAFGLKTLPVSEYGRLAAEAARLLRSGGQVALVEMVLPRCGWLRRVVLGYLAGLLPLLRWLRPEAALHAELPRYASQGPDVLAFTAALQKHGFLNIKQRRLWPGCALLLTAEKPAVS